MWYFNLCHVRDVELIKTTVIWYFKLVYLACCCVTSLFQTCVKYISQKRLALKIHWRKKKEKKKQTNIIPYGSCQGSFIHLSCLFESSRPRFHVNSHLHSHLSPACGPASNHPPVGVCCLRFPASLIDSASSLSWGDTSSSVRPIWICL